MHNCPSAELRDGAILARDCLAYSRSLPDVLTEQAALARQRGDDCRLRGMLLLTLTVVDELAPSDLPPEIRDHLHTGRWQRIEAILSGGASLLAELGRCTQSHYERRPLRFAGRLSVDSILARRADEGRFAPMRWAKSDPAASNWMIPKR